MHNAALVKILALSLTMSVSQHPHWVFLLCSPSVSLCFFLYLKFGLVLTYTYFFYIFFSFWICEAQRLWGRMSRGIRHLHPPLSFFIPPLCHAAPLCSLCLDMLRFPPLLIFSSPLCGPLLIYPFTVLSVFHPGCFPLLLLQNFTAHLLQLMQFQHFCFLSPALPLTPISPA